MRRKTLHMRNSTKRSFRHCGTAAGLLIPRSSKFRSTSRWANEGVMKVGISLVILLAPAAAFAQTYPPPIRTPQGQMLLGPLTLPAGGASDWTKAASFEIIDQLNHQDDF